MNVKTAIESRRSVKAFDPDHRMSEAEVRELLSQALLAPTAFNIQNWRFVAVQDAALRQEIRKVAWDQSQVTDASLLLVMCADLKAWDKNPERSGAMWTRRFGISWCLPSMSITSARNRYNVTRPCAVAGWQAWR